jgi:hypothetical protein
MDLPSPSPCSLSHPIIHIFLGVNHSWDAGRCQKPIALLGSSSWSDPFKGVLQSVMSNPLPAQRGV